MVVHLDSRAERLIEEQLRTGRFHSAEEVVARALESLASGTSAEESVDPDKAVDAILALRSKNSLSLGAGYSLSDLVRESRNLE